MNVENKKIVKRHGFFKWVMVLFFVVIFLLPAIYFSLPFLIEKFVLPKVAAVFNVEFFDADIRHIGVGSIDLADVALGDSSAGELFQLDSARLDYKLGFHGLEVTKVSLSGIELDVSLPSDNQLRIAGKSVENWMQLFDSDAKVQDAPAKKTGKSFVRVNELVIEYSKINFITPQFTWGMPVEMRVKLPSTERPEMICKFKIEQARDSLEGNFQFNVSTGKGNGELKSSLTPQRYFPLFAGVKSFPVSGSLMFALTGEFDINDLRYAASLEIDSRRLKFGDISMNLDMALTLAGMNGTHQITSVNGMTFTMESPFFALDMDEVSVNVNLEDEPKLQVAAKIALNAMDLLEVNLVPNMGITFVNGVAINGVCMVTPLGMESLECGFEFFTMPELRGKIKLESGPDYSFPLNYQDVFAAQVRGFSLEAEAEMVKGGWNFQSRFNVGEVLLSTPQNIEATLKSIRAEWLHLPSSNNQKITCSTGDIAIKTPFLNAGISDTKTILTTWNGVTSGEFELNEFFGATLPIGVERVHLEAELTPTSVGAESEPQPWNIEFTNNINMSGNVVTTPLGWRVSGNMWHVNTSSVMPELELTITHTPNFGVSCNLNVPEMAIDVGLIEEFCPDISKWSIDGNVAAKAEYVFGFGRNGGAAEFSLRGVSAENEELGLKLENVNADFSFPDLPKISSGSAQRIRCEAIKYQGLALDDFYVLFQLLDKEIFIEEAGIRAFDGSIQTYCVHLREGMEEVNLNVFCDRLRLSSFINNFAFAQAAGDGRIYGMIPVVYGKKGVFVKRGFLYSEPGVIESLKIGGLESAAGAGSAEMAVAVEALKDFVYEWVKIEVTDEEDDMLLTATFKGWPKENLPFTFDTNKGGFLRVDSGGAHFQGITLIFRWHVPVNRLLELNSLYGNLKERYEL